MKNHFAKVQPTSIRHRTDKMTGKSKGFAFLEFAAYDRMKTCLKLYHHSSFSDGDKPARKINVELTAGGGGKGEVRKQKLKEKNEKLSVQRKNRMKEEAKKKESRQVEGGEGDSGTKSGSGKPARAPAKPRVIADESSGMHPSRLARMQV